MQKFFKKVNEKKGFTLVETLVAIAIFTSSILAVLSILSQGIIDTSYAKEKVTASYLAQEGIEYIRNIRDTYVVNTSPSQTGWNNFNIKVAGAVYPSGNTVCASANGCYFNPDNIFSLPSPMPITQMTINLCTSATCSNAPLLYDSSNGAYDYTPTGTTINSGFTRKIKVVQVSANETKIVSTVYWTQGSGSYNISFSEDLFNWW